MYAGSVPLLKALVWLQKGMVGGGGGGGGEQEALWVDAVQAEHKETRTLIGVKRGRVIYLVRGHGNTGNIFLLMRI